MYDSTDPFRLTDDPDYASSPDYIHPLFTHGDPLVSAQTEPIPVLSIAGPIRASEPMDAPLPFAISSDIPSDGHNDAELTSRELMWGLTVVGFLCPLFGALAGGFIGFFVGTALGLILGVCASLTRMHRVRQINQGRTDLEFSPAERNVENVMAAAVAVYAGVKVVNWMEHRHARMIADEINKR